MDKVSCGSPNKACSLPANTRRQSNVGLLRWASIADGGQTVSQHWFDVSVFSGYGRSLDKPNQD